MHNHEGVNKTIEDFAENIAKEISEIRFYEVAHVKAIAKTRLWLAIKECLKYEVWSEQEKMQELKEKLDKVPGYLKPKVQTELAKAKLEMKQQSRLLGCMSNYDEYEQLRHYLIDRIGREYWEDFKDNYLNRDEYRQRRGSLS